jgi:MerR family mercuric resistance operon transcriptional regulator
MEYRMTIGQVAKAAEVNIETIRFYQRKGLIAAPPKQLEGFRYYGNQTIEDIRFIKRAQAIGFTLNETKELLVMDGCVCCEQAHNATLIKLKMLEAKIAELEGIRKTLQQLLGKCEKEKFQAPCPIIDKLLQG